MQDDGILLANADPDALATGLMAALQGGYLLAQANHDVAPMATALNMALAHIESLTSSTKTAKPRKTATSSRRAGAAQPRRKTTAKR
jgi:TetR/AcrR family transcriptional regulator, transcriptional repressor for nem operon